MCTLTYLSDSSLDYIITTNRDESSEREHATWPQYQNIAGKKVLFPKDPVAGGTWVAVSTTGRIVCLLNGAFGSYDHSPPYRKSRGLVVLDVFKYDRAEQFAQQYPLQDIAPFTMVIFDLQQEGTITEIRWDEKQRYVKKIDPQVSHIWSSPNLFDERIRRQRRVYFQEWLSAHDNIDPQAVWDFHHRKKEEGNAGFLLYPDDEVSTLSVTSMAKQQSRIYYRHEDLIRQQEKRYTLSLIN